jgi:hypothetical protein
MSNTPIELNELVRNSLSQNCEVLSEQDFHQINIVRWKCSPDSTVLSEPAKYVAAMSR